MRVVLVTCIVLLAIPPQTSGTNDRELFEDIGPYGGDYDTAADTDGADVIEGDIKISKPSSLHDVDKRNIVKEDELWPGGIIPYEIKHTGKTPDGKTNKEHILEALEMISKATCVKFRERTDDDRYWVKFVDAPFCSSHVGRRYEQYQPQEVTLKNPNCFRGHTTILHEVMHAMGFYHEQNRPDRNQYVEIKWNNIQSTGGGRQQFNREYNMRTLGRIYDYHSVMHYRRNAASWNGGDTIVPIDYRWKHRELGPTKDALSSGDVVDINLVYKCKGKTNHVAEWSDFDPCMDDGTASRQRWCDRPAECSRAENGVETESRKCTPPPLDGNWGNWGQFAVCNKTCGVEYTSRKRTCNNPAVKHGGAECPGKGVETMKCDLLGCVEKCGGEFQATDTPGEIKSPKYGASYPLNMKCTYRIDAAEGKYVKLTFTEFQLDDTRLRANMTCFGDSVEIYYDGSNTKRKFTLCGKYHAMLNRHRMGKHDAFVSTGSTLIIKFNSNNNRGYYENSLQRFKATFQAVNYQPKEVTEVTGCGGEFVAEEKPQVITSPGYPYGYAPNLNCMYKITAPIGLRVRVTIKRIHLYIGPRDKLWTRCADYLKLWGNMKLKYYYTKCCWRGCNDERFYSTVSNMEIQFKSDGAKSTSDIGFKLVYEAIPMKW